MIRPFSYQFESIAFVYIHGRRDTCNSMRKSVRERRAAICAWYSAAQFAHSFRWIRRVSISGVFVAFQTIPVKCTRAFPIVAFIIKLLWMCLPVRWYTFSYFKFENHLSWIKNHGFGGRLLSRCKTRLNCSHSMAWVSRRENQTRTAHERQTSVHFTLISFFLCMPSNQAHDTAA